MQHELSHHSGNAPSHGSKKPKRFSKASLVERTCPSFASLALHACLQPSRYQDMAAEGLVAFDELRTKPADLEKVREAAEQELESLRSCKERLEELKKDRDALLGS